MNSDTIETYLDVLNGASWPKNFFNATTKERRIKEIFSYIFEQEHFSTPEASLKNINKDFIEKYKLNDVLKVYGKVAEMLPEQYDYITWIVYPDSKPDSKTLTLKVYLDVLEGRRKNFPTGYFTNGADIEEKAQTCFKYLCEDILKLDNKGIIATFGNSKGIKVLSQYKLKILVDIIYESLSQLLISTYPNIYKTV